MAIHPTAIIDGSAELGDVEIGPYVVIGPRVRLADGVVVGAHAVVERDTEIGAGTRLSPHVVLGGDPQDAKYKGEPTRLVVGRENIFREFSTAHRGSMGTGVTTIGDHNMFMANSHIAHDCTVGSDTMFANSAAIAGHVTVGDGAILGGLAGVHQFARIGRLAMVGAGAMCAQDVPPFTLAQGDRARLYGLNVIGLRRAGFGSDGITGLKHAWRTLFVEGTAIRAAMARVRAEHADEPAVAELLDFLDTTQRGVCRAAIFGEGE
jgi:UDP-N-acetylglucosamine acyltransferase